MSQLKTSTRELTDKGFLVVVRRSDQLGLHWFAALDDLCSGLLR
jgi:hypothetical protein